MFSEASQTEWRQPFDFPSISPVNGEYPNHVISGISLLHDKGLKSGCRRKPGKMLKMSTEGGQQNKFILTS